MELNLVSLLLNLSASLDFTGQGINHHHQRVALISLQLGRTAGLEPEALFELFKAAIIHDAGAVTWRQKQHLLDFDLGDSWEHCERGYRLFRNTLLDSSARVILSHHDCWRGNNRTGLSGEGIPLASRIIHLADRVDVSIRDGQNILNQQESILGRIQEHAGEMFDPDLVPLLVKLAGRESFWLDLTSPWTPERLLDLLPHRRITVTTGELREIAALFARIIDTKSTFTYGHSQAVARVARSLGEELGFPEAKTLLLEIAGLLHDLGKLTVPEQLLEKPGALTPDEYQVIRQHPYYTYWWLKPVIGEIPLAEWAAYHHEQLNGEGYPFHRDGSCLDLEAQLIRAADLFTALHEKRPYRPGLGREAIEGILNSQVANEAMNGRVVSLILANYDTLARLV